MQAILSLRYGLKGSAKSIPQADIWPNTLSLLPEIPLAGRTFSGHSVFPLHQPMIHLGKKLIVLWLRPTLGPPLREVIPGSSFQLPSSSSCMVKGIQQEVHTVWTCKQLHLL